MRARDSRKMQKREEVEIIHLPPSYTEPEKPVEEPVLISEGSRGRRPRRQKQLDLPETTDTE